MKLKTNKILVVVQSSQLRIHATFPIKIHFNFVNDFEWSLERSLSMKIIISNSRNKMYLLVTKF